MTADGPRPRSLLRWPTYCLGQLHAVARSRMEPAFAAAGLSLRTHFVLVCLEEFGELSQQQVSDRLKVDRSDMVGLVDELERRGEVVRRRDGSDRRRYILALTPAGRRSARRAEELIATITDEVLAALSESERRTLHQLTLRALGESVELAQAPALRHPLR